MTFLTAAPAKPDTLIFGYTQGFTRNHVSHQLLPLKGTRLAGRGKPEVRNLLLFVWVCFLSKCRASSSAWEQTLRLKNAPDRTSLMGARLRARRFRNKCLKLAIAKSRSLMKPWSVPTLLFFYLNPDSRKHLGTLVLQKLPSPLLHNMNCQPKSICSSWYFTEQWAFFQFAFPLQTMATLFSTFFPLKLGFCIIFPLCV